MKMSNLKIGILCLSLVSTLAFNSANATPANSLVGCGTVVSTYADTGGGIEIYLNAVQGLTAPNPLSFSNPPGSSAAFMLAQTAFQTNSILCETSSVDGRNGFFIAKTVQDVKWTAQNLGINN